MDRGAAKCARHALPSHTSPAQGLVGESRNVWLPTGAPGGEWNNWSAGSPAENAFVSVNTVHIFDDDTLWVVDQAAPGFGSVLPGAQKVVQIDTQARPTRSLGCSGLMPTSYRKGRG